ncbi:MAG TPA: hypothetical protein PLR06_04550 [Cyclobacteriaceae bacterium]|nr:hypothetical protein [Cyclobacteriaceae bacterium]
MLRHFRINDPYRLFSLLVLLVLASLPFLISLPLITSQELKQLVIGEVIGAKLMYVQIIDSTGPLMALADGILNFLFGRSILARHLMALVIIFFQAGYFGILLINNKAYNDINYVPSLIFGFLCFFSFDLLAITPEILASGLLLLGLNNLFKEIEFRIDRDAFVLNLGVFIGLASLFVFSYTIFLFGSILILIIFARISLRKISLLIFGYGIVHAALIIFYYCYERADELWVNFYLANFSPIPQDLVSLRSVFFLGLVPLIYFVFSLFMLTREARFTRYQSQLFQVMFVWLGISIIQVWLTPEFTPHSLMTFIPPLAYFISHYLLLINRKWIAELMLWIFIFGLLGVNHLSRNEYLKNVDYSALFPAQTASEIAGKRIMILDDNLSLYQRNRMAGYFLNWELSKKYFDGSDDYEDMHKINQSFFEDPPDVIIDPHNMMEPIMRRIPAVEKKYRKEDGIYRRN